MARRVRTLSAGGRLVFVGVAAVVVALVGAARLAPATLPAASPLGSPVVRTSPSPPSPPSPSILPATTEQTFPSGPEAYLIGMQLPTRAEGVCGRFTQKHAAAIAMVSCRVSGTNGSIYFSLYEDAGAMTSAYNRLMSKRSLAATVTGCSDSVQSNSAWTYPDEGAEGPPQGLLACYPHPLGSTDGVQYIWTFDALMVMVEWRAPTYGHGYYFFKAWADYFRP